MGDDWLSEVYRLEQIHTAMWDKAAAGDVEALNTLTRVERALARLFGLDVCDNGSHDGTATPTRF